MISCTEFIPSYSTLFTFLEENYGVEEVHRYWEDLFDPKKNGPTHLLEEELSKNGIVGCWNYWTHTLNEEAADFDLYLDEENGWYLCRMRHCPSKGRLLAIRHMTPYHDYCSHCDLYRRTVEQYGLKYVYNFTGCGEANCELLIYDPAKFRDTLKVSPKTRVMHRSASDNRYFHKDFHLSMNAGVEYVGTRFGNEAVDRYLREYALAYFAPMIERMKQEGITPLEEYLRNIYAAEEAQDVLKTVREGEGLHVFIRACPAVSHIKASGRTVSRWYDLTTTSVMDAIAKAAGFRFTMLYYDEDTGRAEYAFSK